MCPFCLAAMGLVVAKAASAGALTAVAVKLSRKKNDAKEIPNSDSNERSNSNESSSEDVQKNGR